MEREKNIYVYVSSSGCLGVSKQTLYTENLPELTLDVMRV